MTWSVGSRWVRWDPHLHTPGTLFNDQYNDQWDGFFDAIEAAMPAVSVVGITDYASLSGYEAFRAHRGNRLPGLLMTFANIELRLSLNTKRGGAINAHLLISPDDPEHIVRTKEALHTREFKYGLERYPCTDDGLRRLGVEGPRAGCPPTTRRLLRVRAQ